MAAKIPYIGSKISLISKAAIRYEGTLYTINPYEATVALANVRSFGTEDREANLVVPPREEVYEYIIFRGSDIRDIHVCEPPPPTPPHDPAIVESSQPKPIGSDSHGGLPGATSGYAAFSHLNRPQPGGGAPGSGRLPPQLSQHQPFPQAAPSSQSSTPAAASTRSTSDSVGRQTPTQDQSTQVSQTALKKSSQQGSKPASKNGSRGSTPTHERQSPERQHDRRKQYNTSGFYRQHQNGPPQHQRRFNDRGGFHDGGRGGFHHDSTRGGYEHRGGFEGRGAWRGNRGDDRGADRGEGGWREQHQRGREFRPRGGGRGGGPRPEHGEFVPHSGAPRGRGGMRGRGRGMGGNKPQKLTFDEDFDFDAANAQFNKEDLEKELREKLSLGEPADGEKAVNGDDGGAASGSEDESEIYYDKDNFFDNISCEASDREKGKRSRPNWKEERKTNTETFGLSSTRDLRYYGRGGMRGRGGPYRGGPRGGGRGGYGGYGQRGGGRGGYGPRGGGRGGPREGGRPSRSNDGSKLESGPKEVETSA